ncbi:3-phosphoshikimate 1-carboxyvinyltransferase [Acidipila rosea]|uniref:3-phosphoshikimate 1-carboxyvinyltransferase n=1 Tax=Acidipila rosea TaxID=768535 RepID=A0A4V2PVT8_9BACT|nr:3-phosphoshikimate 1-carboxyvinyltransferase [Acidipila rosea]MBW4025794.1 3-phosphoshikimate 1-carboxyvinyltransferase [Acidobacteriota bacterium]MBW4044287.1 3-phosphoshikimate 1-carboxyvinyltransferase [Acidobacteriota bacterium]TCK75681.1 3-phosphoshikimate 1-carboxyvinyltransferase [Acidipila rosea]
MNETLTEQIIRPARNINGSLRLPGDKSISHRYALLGGLAEGTTRLANFSTGADCASSLGCVEALGAEITRSEDGGVEIKGVGGRFAAPDAPLDCGNSGSTMRMLSGLLAPQAHTFTLVGDASLSRRPMERVRKPLMQMGAEIELTEGHAPVTIRGKALKGIDYTTPVPSAQVKTALLFAGMQAEGTTTVHESVRTRDHGELALRAFGANVERTLDSVSIAGGQTLRAIEAVVPGDISSAAFFFCAAALFPGSNLIFDGLGMNPTRATLCDVLTALGAHIGVLNLEDKFGELVGTVQINAPKDGMTGTTISGGLAAQLIDELPVLAAIAPYTANGIRIRDAKELRVKESDRIALVAKNLRAMGAEVEEFEDGLDVPGGQPLRGAVIDAGGDHRIAMAFSVAALRAEGETLIRGAESAAISFPEFFTLLDRVCER